MSQIPSCVSLKGGQSYPSQAFVYLSEMEHGALECVRDGFINSKKRKEMQVFPFLHLVSGLWVSWACLATVFTVSKGIFSSAVITKR